MNTNIDNVKYPFTLILNIYTDFRPLSSSTSISFLCRILFLFVWCMDFAKNVFNLIKKNYRGSNHPPWHWLIWKLRILLPGKRFQHSYYFPYGGCISIPGGSRFLRILPFWKISLFIDIFQVHATFYIRFISLQRKFVFLLKVYI